MESIIEKPIKCCQYCGTTDNLIIKTTGQILPVCEQHKQLYYKKLYNNNKNYALAYRKKHQHDNYKCKYCGRKDNLYSYNSGMVLNCCIDHYNLYINEKNKKRKDMCNSKYGCDNVSNSKIINDKKIKKLKSNYWDIFLIKLKQKNIEPLFDKKYYIQNNIFKFKCLSCNKEFDSSGTEVQHIRCECSVNRSSAEEGIYNWLLTVIQKNEIEKNKWFNINGIKRELDLYLPYYNIGIEHNGLYWHSELFLDKKYHQEKWKLFKNKEIHIIQIFENEWINKQEIIKSIIMSKLNINQVKVYARKTIIKEIDNTTYKLFLEKNHIQGYGIAKVKLGMFLDNELISVVSIGQNRFKKNETEIIRYCSKLNYQIIGGLAKFLMHIKNNYKFENIISYIDLRYFDGSSYLNNGFILESISNPNYYYFKNKNKLYLTLYNRIQFQKHKLKDKLEIFDEKLSEHDNMLINNYYRIFDAGNYKLKLMQ